MNKLFICVNKFEKDNKFHKQTKKITIFSVYIDKHKCQLSKRLVKLCIHNFKLKQKFRSCIIMQVNLTLITLKRVNPWFRDWPQTVRGLNNALI